MKNIRFNPGKAGGHGIVFVTIFIWSIAFVFTKVLLEYITPIDIMVIRTAMALLLLTIIYPRYEIWTGWRNEFLFFLIGGTGIFLYFILENKALIYTGASNVGIIVTSAPVFTALAAHFITREERLDLSGVLGIVIAFGGVFWVLSEGVSLNMNPAGDFLALGGAVAFGVYSLLLKRTDERFTAIFVTRKSFFYGFVWMGLYLLFSPDKITPANWMVLEIWPYLVFLGILSSSLCFLMWGVGVRLIGPVTASNYIYLVPLITAIVAVIFLGEQLTDGLIFGGIFIVAGLIQAQRKVIPVHRFIKT